MWQTKVNPKVTRKRISDKTAWVDEGWMSLLTENKLRCYTEIDSHGSQGRGNRIHYRKDKTDITQPSMQCV